MNLQDWLGIFNFIVLTITAVVVFIYTRAAQRSNEIQEKPVINLKFEKIGHSGFGQADGKLKIKNIGKGPAYNILFSNIKLNEGEKTYSYKFYLENPFLEPDQETEPSMFIHTPTGVEAPGMSRFLFRLIPQHLGQEANETMRKNPAIFLMNYQGLNGGYYYSVFKLYSTLPPLGEMIMQFVKHSSGCCSIEEARKYCDQAENLKSSAENG